MGRSGGGGGHSSGGFSGGHSSGGWSGGGRSSRSYSSSSSSSRSSYHRSYGIGPSFYSYSYSGGNFGMSMVNTIFIIFIICVLLIGFGIYSSDYNKIPKSTKNRTALSNIVSKTEWYRDDLGWITNKSTLVSGLEKFYKTTGVQPYVMLISYSSEFWNGNNINAKTADAYLEQVYADTFKDEGHFIFAYFECKNDSKSEMDGEFRYLVGYAADSIMDSEALSIFWGYFQKHYYNTSLSIETMYANTFSDTAKSIMSKATNGWDAFKVFMIIIGIIIVVIVSYKVIKIRAKRKKEKEDYNKEILSKPLETFGKDTKELEEKYKDKEN